jgi:hypothetical protein
LLVAHFSFHQQLSDFLIHLSDPSTDVNQSLTKRYWLLQTRKAGKEGKQIKKISLRSEGEKPIKRKNKSPCIKKKPAPIGGRKASEQGRLYFIIFVFV